MCLTFAIRIMKPVGTLVTKMCKLWLALNMHALIVSLEKFSELILLVPSVLDNEVLMPLSHILK